MTQPLCDHPDVLPERLRAIMDFLLLVDRFKTIERQSFLTGATRAETDAEHTWHMCLYAMLLHGEVGMSCDLAHAIKLILVHDLVEIYAGDAPAYDERAQAAKAGLEQAAADKLFARLPADLNAELRGLWQEFEAAGTPEARFANAIDRIQALGQSLLCGGHGWTKNGARREQVEARMAPARAADPLLDRLVGAMFDLAERTGIWPRQGGGHAD